MAPIPVVAATPEESAALARTRDDVVALTAAVEPALRRCVEAPNSGSAIAGCAISSMDGWWLTCASIAVNAAVDHLRALTVVWTAPWGIPHSAGFTLIRGATEGAARACWLLDPSLNPRERIARGIIERRHADRRLERLSGDTPLMRGRRAELDSAATAAGFTLTDRACDGQSRPGMTALMKSLLPAPTTSGATSIGEFAYSVLSAYPHAEPWVVMPTLQPIDSGGLVSYVDVAQQIQVLRGAALRLLNLAMCSIHALAGRDVEAWKREALPFVFGATTG